MKVLGWLRTGYGLLLLVDPVQLNNAVGSDNAGGERSAERRGRAVVRVLGAREAVQAIVSAPRPTADLLRLGAGVDAVHAATMLLLAAQSPPWRRRALFSAATASFFAVLGLRATRSLSPPDQSRRHRNAAPRDPLARLLDLRDHVATTLLETVPGVAPAGPRPAGRP